MFEKLLAIITDCRGLAGQVTALRARVTDLEAQIAAAAKGQAQAEAEAQALRDELAAAVSGFQASGN